MVETTRTGFEIAVVGMAGRFPEALNLNDFWQNLINGVDAVSKLTTEELKAVGVEESLLNDPAYVRSKGVFPELEYFDASFFGYTPRDAEIMDPQMRMLHQGVYHALEDAGYSDVSQKRNIALITGASGNMNWELSTLINASNTGSGQFAAMQLNDKDYMATRLAYKLNLHGPSTSVHTACSTSLYAIDLACRYLYTGACSMAVAAGCSLTLPQKNGYLYEEGMIRSPDGRCRPFSDEAEGTIEANGMGAVVLKPLENAISDRDRIYAVIRSSATNNDGNRKVGYTAPSIEGQSEAIRRALYMADISPETVTYIESHGTGTRLGDPVEIAGLSQAFKTEKKEFCAIGSLKSNFGHLDTAAGVASFIKTSLALSNQTIPASLHCERVNPQIKFEESPFYVVKKTMDWKRLPHPDKQGAELPLRAGVSSFGIGGTNVHMILEEAPEPLPSKPGRSWNTLCLSASDDNGLNRVLHGVHEHLSSNTDISPNDLAYSYQIGRDALRSRVTIPYKNTRGLLASIGKKLAEGALGLNSKLAMKAPRVAFLYPGQGTQYPGMAADLYHSEPVFRGYIDKCLTQCDEMDCGYIRSLLLSRVDGDDELIQETHNAQLCLFIIEYATTKLLAHWCITPDVMIGHSLGEYTAATISGVMTVDQALRLIHARGAAMQTMQPGSMCAVAASHEIVSSQMPQDVELAAINSPEQCTVSGPTAAIEVFRALLQESGIDARILKTSHAFHSSMMHDAIQIFEKSLSGIELKEPQIPYVSNLSGDWIQSSQAMSDQYYLNHMRSTVRFSDGARLITEDKNLVSIEVGPGLVLGALLKQNSESKDLAMVSVVKNARNNSTGDEFLAKQIGELWANGVIPNWQAFYKGQERNKIQLPLYPFERQKFPVGKGDVRYLLNSLGSSSVDSASELVESEFGQPNSAGNIHLLGEDPCHYHWLAEPLPALEDKFKVQSAVIMKYGSSPVKLLNMVGGLRAVHVSAGKVFGQKKNHDYKLDWNQPEHIQKLIVSLAESGQIPDVFVWTLKDTMGKQLQKLKNCLLRTIQSFSQNCPYNNAQFVVLVDSRSETSELSAYYLDIWVRSMRAVYPSVNIKIVLIQNINTTRHYADLVERELFARDNSTHVYLLDGCSRSAFKLSKATSSLVLEQRLKHKKVALFAPENYPIDQVSSLIEKATGAEVVSLQLDVDHDSVLSGTSKQKFESVFIIDVALAAARTNLEEAVTSFATLYAYAVERALTKVTSNTICLVDSGFTSNSAETTSALQLIKQKLNDAINQIKATKTLVYHVHVPHSISDNAIRIQVPTLHDIQETAAIVDSGWKFAVVKPLQQEIFNLVALDTINCQSEVTVELDTTPGTGIDEKADFVLRVVSQWQKLLGVETINLDSDFFELGGDSLKVAQLASEFEKEGISIPPNAIFTYPTVRELSNYLEVNFGDGNTSILSLSDLEAYFKSRFDAKCVFQPYDVEGISHLVMFMEDSVLEAVSLRGIESEFLDLRLSGDLIPNLVRPLSTFEESDTTLSEDYFSRLCSLKKVNGLELSSLLSQVRYSQKKMSKVISEQAVASKYDVSTFQKMVLKSDSRVTLFQMQFNEMLNIDLLEQAFHDIVLTHGLLRSSLFRQRRKMQWVEHQFSARFNLPRIDLIDYTSVSTQTIFERLATEEYEADFDAEKGVMYHVLLVRKDLCSYTLLFNLDHAIFDNMSGQILQRQLKSRYKALMSGDAGDPEVVRPFKDYLDQINCGPQGVTPAELINEFDLKNFSKAKKSVEQKILATRTNSFNSLHYEIDLRAYGLPEDEESSWDTVLTTLCHVLSKYFDEEDVPLKILHQGRVYQGLTFYDTLGLFVDVLPLLVKVSSGRSDEMIEDIREKLNIVNRYNLNFINLMRSVSSFFRWKEILGYTTPRKLPMKDPMILLNYTGKAGNDYREFIELTTSKMLNSGKMDFASLYIIGTLTDGKIMLDLICNFEQDMKKLEYHFDQECLGLFGKKLEPVPAQSASIDQKSEQQDDEALLNIHGE